MLGVSLLFEVYAKMILLLRIPLLSKNAKCEYFANLEVKLSMLIELYFYRHS